MSYRLHRSIKQEWCVTKYERKGKYGFVWSYIIVSQCVYWILGIRGKVMGIVIHMSRGYNVSGKRVDLGFWSISTFWEVLNLLLNLLFVWYFTFAYENKYNYHNSYVQHDIICHRKRNIEKWEDIYYFRVFCRRWRHMKWNGISSRFIEISRFLAEEQTRLL